MAIRLPEILVHRPPLPVPESKGKSRWYENPLLRVSMALATVGAGAGLAYQLFTGADRGPALVPRDNAPITDTLKPPVDNQPSLVPVPPLVDSGPSTPPQPPENPMDQALKSGKIDLGTSNSQDYFKGVSTSEAQNSSTPEFPVNPKRNPNLKVTNEGDVLALDNVENNEPIRACETGTFKIDNGGGGKVGESYKLARVELGGKKYLIYIKEARIPEQFTWGETYQVNAGDTLFYVTNSNAVLPSGLSKNQHQIEVLVQGGNNPDSPLANFVGADGKIPFIDDSPQGK